MEWFGTVRGRIGYALDSALLYATGGFAYGGVSYKGNAEFQNSFFPAFGFSNSRTTDTGYAAGGGVEYKLSSAWSAKVEYQYINLGTDKLTSPAVSGAIVSVKADNDYHTVRAGLDDLMIGDALEILMRAKAEILFHAGVRSASEFFQQYEQRRALAHFLEALEAKHLPSEDSPADSH
ncbi:MAG: outer membrane beta-barrel protein [Rhodomicrobium sp.]